VEVKLPEAEALPLNVIESGGTKLRPSITTVSPTAPLVGKILQTVGPPFGADVQDDVGVGVAVGTGVGDAVGRGVGDAVGRGVGVAVGTGVGVAVETGVCVAVGCGVGLAVGEGVGAELGVDVGVGVIAGVAVAVACGVGLAVGEGVACVEPNSTSANQFVAFGANVNVPRLFDPKVSVDPLTVAGPSHATSQL
jgi:hypothetical protein